MTASSALDADRDFRTAETGFADAARVFLGALWSGQHVASGAALRGSFDRALQTLPGEIADLAARQFAAEDLAARGAEDGEIQELRGRDLVGDREYRVRASGGQGEGSARLVGSDLRFVPPPNLMLAQLDGDLAAPTAWARRAVQDVLHERGVNIVEFTDATVSLGEGDEVSRWTVGTEVRAGGQPTGWIATDGRAQLRLRQG